MILINQSLYLFRLFRAFIDVAYGSNLTKQLLFVSREQSKKKEGLLTLADIQQKYLRTSYDNFISWGSSSQE